MATEYRGYRRDHEWVVMRCGGDAGGVAEWVVVLNPRNDLFNHSPDGFAWGYSGSGPSQLALALLADYFSWGCETKEEAKAADTMALRLYQPFKTAVIAPLDQDSGWVLTVDDIKRGIAAAEGIMNDINKESARLT